MKTLQQAVEREAEHMKTRRKKRAAEMDWKETMSPEQRKAYNDYVGPIREAMAEIETRAALPSCDTCGGIGVVKYDVPIHDNRFGKLFPCPAQGCVSGMENHERRQEKMLDASGLPDLFQTCTFSSWRSDIADEDKAGKWMAQAHAELFVQNGGNWVSKAEVMGRFSKPVPDGMDTTPKNSIVFSGTYGVGKTGLAAAIFNAVLEQGGLPLYIRADDIIAKVQATYDKDSEHNKDQVLNVFKQAPLLLIDDANMEDSKPDRRQIMEAVIRHRHGHLMPTIVTTNESRRGWEMHWGSRAAHALFEMAHWVEVTGPAVRRLS
jgi:DNA replication protein DnaC